MSPVLVGLIVFACVYGGAALGFVLRRWIHPEDLDEDTREILKVATGLIGTMAALVLGLLVASAKTYFDTQKDELTQVCADVALLDRALAHYGPDAAAARATLRDSVAGAFGELWRYTAAPPSAEGEKLFEIVQDLRPSTDQQVALKEVIVQLTAALGKTRWLMHAQRGSSVLTPLLIVVVFWLAIIFTGFGVYARPNVVVRVALLVCALSTASAIYLILEMDHPFSGLTRISDEPLRDVLSRVAK